MKVLLLILIPALAFFPACTDPEAQQDFRILNQVVLQAECDMIDVNTEFSFDVYQLQEGFFLKLRNKSGQEFQYWTNNHEVFVVNAEASSCSPTMEKAPAEILRILGSTL